MKSSFLAGVCFAAGVGEFSLIMAAVSEELNTFGGNQVVSASLMNQNFERLRNAITAIDPQYSNSETLTHKVWIDGKPIYRKVVDTGAMPNSACKLVNHGLGASSTHNIIGFRGLYWRADNSQYFPMPSAADLDIQNVRLAVKTPDIEICTATGFGLFVNSFVILEYTKN